MWSFKDTSQSVSLLCPQLSYPLFFSHSKSHCLSRGIEELSLIPVITILHPSFPLSLHLLLSYLKIIISATLAPLCAADTPDMPLPLGLCVALLSSGLFPLYNHKANALPPQRFYSYVTFLEMPVLTPPIFLNNFFGGIVLISYIHLF